MKDVSVVHRDSCIQPVAEGQHPRVARGKRQHGGYSLMAQRLLTLNIPGPWKHLGSSRTQPGGEKSP